jgi:hypothetical protein
MCMYVSGLFSLGVDNRKMPKHLLLLLYTVIMWVRRWFRNILVEIIKHPKTRFEIVPKMLKEAFNELEEVCDDKLRIENELKFTHRVDLPKIHQIHQIAILVLS